MLVFVVSDNEFPLRIVDDYIGVQTHLDGAFAVVYAEQFCRVRCRYLDSFLEGDPAFVRFGKDVRVHVLDACTAIGDGREIPRGTVFARYAPVLLGFQERTVVSSQGGYIACAYAIPERMLGVDPLHRRRTYEVASPETEFGYAIFVNFIGESKVLRTCLCKDRIAFIPGRSDCFDALSVVKMHDVERSACHFCEVDGSDIGFTGHSFVL